jgi:hypothetical protein
MKLIKKMWDEKPLQLILFVAGFIRLFSVIFSKGYGMHDDHFLVIEESQSWVDGFDYNNWLPSSQIGAEVPTPTGHSFFYSGLHYFLFLFLKAIGMDDPQNKMYVIRLIHAALSILTIYWGYKITEKVAGKQQAKMVGILLSLFWFMPFMSVRNLVEFVCITPLMYATWIVIKNEEKKIITPYILAGIMLGIAFSIRFQTVMFTGGFGLALLFTKRIKEALVLGFFFFLVAALVQGLTDYFIWGRPFVEFAEYIRYNIENARNYFVQQWYMYLLLIGGILIPPISLFIFFGFMRSWKKHLLLFLPSFIFLVFHCYFSNKQERFILPIIPFIILLGYIGWSDFISTSKYWLAHKKLMRNFWIYFWIMNTIPLLVVSVAYSKRNRVEAMTYIAAKGDVTSILIEDSNRDDFIMPPLFYLKKWGYVAGITKLKPTDVYYNTEYANSPQKNRPNYVVFMQEDNLDERVATLKKYIPTLSYEATIEPSFIDKLMHWLNPVNKNQVSFVYKIK